MLVSINRVKKAFSRVKLRLKIGVVGSHSRNERKTDSNGSVSGLRKERRIPREERLEVLCVLLLVNRKIFYK